MHVPDAASIKAWLKKHQWLIVAGLFFVIFKFTLVTVLWHGRIVPPSPDDSSVYLLHLDSVLDCPVLFGCADSPVNFGTYAGVDHLVYRVGLGWPGRLLGWDALETYRCGFYIGTVLLALALIFFLSKLNDGKQRLTAYSLFILALYNGAGSYHGFFWVVPSFFALLFFFLILGIFFDRQIRRWPLYLALLVPLGIFSHVLGLYLLAVLPFYCLFNAALEKRIDWLCVRKSIFAFSVALLFYVPTVAYFSSFSYGNPYGPETLIQQVSERRSAGTLALTTGETGRLPGERNLLPGWEGVSTAYFRWIFPSWIGYVIFATCLWLNYRYRRYRIISLYLAAVLFTLAASLNPHGERSLIFLWPVTFIFYGQASWLGLKWASENLKPGVPVELLRMLIMGVTVFFVILASMYSFLWNRYLNSLRDIVVPEDVLMFLSESVRHEAKVMYATEVAFLDNWMTLDGTYRKPGRTLSLDESDYYVTLDEATLRHEKELHGTLFAPFFDILSRVLLFQHEIPPARMDGERVTEGMRVEYSSGPVQIYDSNPN